MPKFNDTILGNLKGVKEQLSQSDWKVKQSCSEMRTHVHTNILCIHSKKHFCRALNLGCATG